jgi:hypothetical protein
MGGIQDIIAECLIKMIKMMTRKSMKPHRSVAKTGLFIGEGRGGCFLLWVVIVLNGLRFG